ncbi:chloramphenicol acetyltransferase [Shewanella sp. C32]|uniref:Chloramphenicol acetyltransferase n=1 Tax=Shewanella electrica TaxID=515560 RepID=A0ABT2FN66_9GAMM|nr:chloramphenicol acetyltransferase [Shewanella electrica]MCH1926248.1 chloramphenicol acetyltransferase [Shewanella electrica]MCS4557784.1 chloramphenicol acetyltransferase [Shewanella electrica]
MEVVDIDTWKRKEHFMFFKDMDSPFFNLCFDLDITPLYQHIKQHKLPFYHAVIYYVMACVNSVEAFKYRYDNERVVKHDALQPSFTVLDGDDELFKIITVLNADNFQQFVSDSRDQASTQTSIIDAQRQQRSDLVYITSIPWVSFTSIAHPITLAKFDAVPRIAWGKYKKEQGKVLLPFSVQAHHAFIDGIHIGKLTEVIERNMARLAEIFG